MFEDIKVLCGIEEFREQDLTAGETSRKQSVAAFHLGAFMDSGH